MMIEVREKSALAYMPNATQRFFDHFISLLKHKVLKTDSNQKKIEKIDVQLVVIKRDFHFHIIFQFLTKKKGKLFNDWL